MDKVIIRLARQDELRQVQDLNYELFLSDNRHFGDLNTDWPYKEGEAYFSKRIAGTGGVCFVAEQKGEIIGYIAGGWSHLNFSANKGKRAELENICVSEKVRSQGIGTLLVRALYKWSKQNGATHIMVDVYSPNIRAYKFYEKLGFEPYSNILWHEL